MTNFVQNLMLTPGIDTSSLYDVAFLVLNLPGQPMTLYDQNKTLSSTQIADIYDRVLFKCCDHIKADLFSTDLIFLSFGYGSLIAATLVLNIGSENNLIKKFIAFNGIFKIDQRLMDSYNELSDALEEADAALHPKILDIVNNRSLE